MKTITVLLLIVVTAVAAPFTFQGEKYDTQLSPGAMSLDHLPAPLDHLPAWNVGAEEPPLLPNQAYKAAKAKLDLQFGIETDAVVIVLWHQPAIGTSVQAYTYYEVTFSEKLSDAEMKKRLVPVKGVPGQSSAYTANISYYVLMDGRVISPKKTANQAPEPTSTAVTPPADAGDRASGTRGSP
jgi:hypothetical protein